MPADFSRVPTTRIILMLNKCPICNSIKLDAKNENYPCSNEDSFYKEIVNCSNCNSGIALPYKNQTELNHFYNSGSYWSNVSSNYLSAHTLTQANARVDYIVKRVHFKDPFFHTLDVGAGHGHIANALKNKKTTYVHNFSFIEPDNKLSSFIQTNIPEAKRRSFDDTAYKYDLIFLNHILEHTASPLETLKNYTKLLNDDGRIYIEVPHRDDKFKKDVFPHSIFFSKEGVKKMIEHSGLNCIEINCFGSIESVKKPTNFIKKVRLKIIGKIYTHAVNYNFIGLAQKMDRILFDYNSERTDGIWIRALCSK